MSFIIKDNTVSMLYCGEAVCLSACEKNAIRFRTSPNGFLEDRNWTLMPKDTPCKISIDEKRNCAVMENGCLRAELYGNGSVVFFRNGKEILREWYREFKSAASGQWKLHITFRAKEGEHFYGLGHEATDCFDLKGCSIDLRHINAKCAIPYVYSSLGYGFLWNSPATGVCDLSMNRTRWTSDSAAGIDYAVIGGDPRSVCETLADLTGHAPMMPHWATGFWQSRMRYESQDILLSVAEKYKELGIPLSAIIIDYFHWTEQGDYQFDPEYWPDPKAMTKKLHDMGIKVFVSVWPTINEKSKNYAVMHQNNMLIRSARGLNRFFNFYGQSAFIDVTNPATRSYVWDRIRENYLENGIDDIWLDVAEPEINPMDFDNIIMYAGRGDEAALIYPYYYAKMIADGMKQEGRDDFVTLTRCAYLGSQKHGALIWSGDIPSTYESLRAQVKSGLNMSMCGIPWWNTDIGGFYGGDIESDYFRELIVRWFQYGVFSPVMRLHGSRNGHDRTRPINEPTGGDNELWSFGERDLEILKDLVFLREKLRPYIEKHMEIASLHGTPVMRPMFFDYPDDPVCYTTGEQYMFGDDILFAPIVEEGALEKRVYLPAGKWRFAMNGALYEGGAWYTVPAALDEFAAFVRDGAEVMDCFTAWRQ